MNPYQYTQDKTCFNISLAETRPHYLLYRVDFPTAHPTRYQEQNTVLGDFYQPRQKARSPLVILVHGLSDQSAIPCRLLARRLVKRGIACFVLYLVFHTRRMPETIKNRLPNLTPEEWFEAYQVSVTDIRQVVDWAGQQEGIDRDRVGVVGISLGGFVSAISMGIDQRIGAGVFLVTGGNYENTAWKKKDNGRWSESEWSEAQALYDRYLAEVDAKGFDNVKPQKMGYLTDPVTFAHSLKGRPLLMINARWDKYIPREGAIDLWRACGKPPQVWLPAGHASMWLAYPFIGWKIAGFLSSAFRKNGQYT